MNTRPGCSSLARTYASQTLRRYEERQKMHEEGRIKLLFIVSSLAFGGAEKQTVTLVNGLDTRRFKSSLAYLKDEETLLSQIRQQCSAVNAFCCNVRRRVDPAAIRLLARHIRREQIDIIVCANPYSLM